MDENNQPISDSINNTSDQDTELKRLLDQYSDEMNKSESSMPPQEQFPSSSQETASDMTQSEPLKLPQPENEPSLNPGFDSQLPPQAEPPITNTFENQFPRNDIPVEVPINTQSNFVPKKGFNFFKFLFIISLLLFLGVLASLAYILINGQKNEEVAETTNISTTPIETITPEVTAIPTIENPVPMVETVSPSATPTAVKKQNLIPNWKIFETSVYQIQYPGSWVVKDQTEGWSENDKNLAGYSSYFGWYENQKQFDTQTSGNYQLLISTKNKPIGYSSLQEAAIEEEAIKKETPSSSVEISTIQIGEYKLTKLDIDGNQSSIKTERIKNPFFNIIYLLDIEKDNKNVLFQITRSKISDKNFENMIKSIELK